jgi:transposase-like protein
MTIRQFYEHFPTEEAAIEYFLNIRYNGVLTCPHCGSIDYVYRNKGNLKLVQCHICNNSFSPFKDTIFEKTHRDIRDWFYAIHLFLNDKSGVSACNIQREIGGSYKTAFNMMHKIRKAMSNVEMKKIFRGFVEADEAYIGGKPRKQNALLLPGGTLIPRKYPKKKSKRGKGTEKAEVFALRERSTGRVVVLAGLPDEEGKLRLTTEQKLEILEKVCKEGSAVLTDTATEFKPLDGQDSKYFHFTVNHSKGEYCNFLHPWLHTNGVENFWSTLKPEITGTYKHISNKYMGKYCQEFAFRYSNRKNEKMFDVLLEQAIKV